MQKAIIILTGTPRQFINESRKSSWVWTTTIRKEQRGAKDFLLQSIHKFVGDDSRRKTVIKNNRKEAYHKFILILQNVPKGLYNFLESEYGAFQIHVTDSNNRDNETLKHDYVLCEDATDFGEQVKRVIDILTNTQNKTEV